MTVKQTDEDLINHVLAQAMNADTPLAEAIDALKALTAYRTMEQKRKDPPEQEDTDETSFDTFKLALEPTSRIEQNGSPPLRNRRGTGPAGN